MDKHALNKFIEHTDIVFSYTKLLILKTSTSESERERVRGEVIVCVCVYASHVVVNPLVLCV